MKLSTIKIYTVDVDGEFKVNVVAHNSRLAQIRAREAGLDLFGHLPKRTTIVSTEAMEI